ncbi:MAG: hypothetical protein HYR74_06675 [Candidatus Eisenbacteria bacterium]|nr:hypothetical protein [Candidatus Eisenbacteria bacterium]
MHMTERVEAVASDPAGLEALYRATLAAGDAEPFAVEIARRHAAAPADLLMTAWFHRLRPGSVTVAPPTEQRAAAAMAERRARRRQYILAALLGTLLSLLFFDLVGPAMRADPVQFVWGPAAAIAIGLYLLAGRRDITMEGARAGVPRIRPAAAALLLIAVTVWALAARRPGDDALTRLRIVHLPALGWLALGWSILGTKGASGMFAAVRKSVEALITAGLFFAAGAAFVLVTRALFHTIGVDLPPGLLRYLEVGGPGLVIMLAVATVYDPERAPSAQRPDHGFARVIFTAGRLFLPLTLLVLLIYAATIPFRFMEPFRSREVLVSYNVMLFAIIGLMVAATPLSIAEVSDRFGPWLRRGIIALAALTLLVSMYAMAAVIYRTVEGGMTANRLTVLGWNLVNIATLGLLLWRLLREPRTAWVSACHRALRFGLLCYFVWTFFVLIGIPLIWRGR